MKDLGRLVNRRLMRLKGEATVLSHRNRGLLEDKALLEIKLNTVWDIVGRLRAQPVDLTEHWQGLATGHDLDYNIPDVVEIYGILYRREKRTGGYPASHN